MRRRYAAAADEIVRRTGVKEGYCLDLDCGDGSLALALAQRTNLQIYALSPSADERGRGPRSGSARPACTACA